MNKEINPNIDTTTFVNIYEEDFTFYCDSQPREVKSQEEKVMPIYVAKLGAKHLIDLILQKKYGVKNTLQDTDLRRSLWGKILPQLIEEGVVEPKSDDEFKEMIKKQLEEQKKEMKELGDKVQKSNVTIEEEKEKSKTKDEEIAELKKKLEELESPEKSEPKKETSGKQVCDICGKEFKNLAQHKKLAHK